MQTSKHPVSQSLIRINFGIILYFFSLPKINIHEFHRETSLFLCFLKLEALLYGKKRSFTYKDVAICWDLQKSMTFIRLDEMIQKGWIIQEKRGVYGLIGMKPSPDFNHKKHINLPFSDLGEFSPKDMPFFRAWLMEILAEDHLDQTNPFQNKSKDTKYRYLPIENLVEITGLNKATIVTYKQLQNVSKYETQNPLPVKVTQKGLREKKNANPPLGSTYIKTEKGCFYVFASKRIPKKKYLTTKTETPVFVAPIIPKNFSFTYTTNTSIKKQKWQEIPVERKNPPKKTQPRGSWRRLLTEDEIQARKEQKAYEKSLLYKDNPWLPRPQWLAKKKAEKLLKYQTV